MNRRKKWGFLGKGIDIQVPNGKPKAQPLNENQFKSWDSKKSNYKRIDLIPNGVVGGGGVYEGGVTPTPSPTPSSTPIIDCYWNLTDENWENNTNVWNSCQDVVTPTPTPTTSQTPTYTPTNTPTPSITPSITPSSSPIPFDSDAATYLAAVLSAGGTVDSTMSAATNTFFTTLKTQGLYSKMIAFYPILGGTSASHILNGIRSNSTYDLTYNGGWTHNVSGATPNGTNAYANTNFDIISGTTSGSSANLSMGIYLNNFNGASGSYDLDTGVRRPDPDNTHIWWIGGEWAATSSSRYSNENSSGSYTATPSPSLYTMSRIGTSIRIYKGATLDTTATQTSDNGGSLGYKLYLGAISDANVAKFFSKKSQCFAFMSAGLTNTESINLNTAINTYQTTLGRNSY